MAKNILALSFRKANLDDVPNIVKMLSNDPLGENRERFENPLPDVYIQAFHAIADDPNNELVVAIHNNQIVGVLQITFIPYLTYQGGWRALIEGVRISKEYRNQGFGKQMFEWAIGRARERGCHLMQLTTDKSRPDTLKFYESLGFKATHKGMKLHLNE